MPTEKKKKKRRSVEQHKNSALGARGIARGELVGGRSGGDHDARSGGILLSTLVLSRVVGRSRRKATVLKSMLEYEKSRAMVEYTANTPSGGNIARYGRTLEPDI